MKINVELTDGKDWKGVKRSFRGWTRILQRSSGGRAITAAMETNWRLINARLPLTIVSRARVGSQRRASCNSFTYRTSILRVKELIHRRKRDFRYAYVTSNNFYTLIYLCVCFIVSLKFTREEGRKYYSLLLSMIGPLLILNIILSSAKFYNARWCWRIKPDTRRATSKKDRVSRKVFFKKSFKIDFCIRDIISDRGFFKDRKSNKIRWEEVYFDFTELSKRKITLMRKIF